MKRGKLTKRETRELARAHLQAMDALRKSSIEYAILAHIDGARVEFWMGQLVDAGWYRGDLVVAEVRDLDSYGDGWEQVRGSYVTRDQIFDMTEFLEEDIRGIPDLLALAQDPAWNGRQLQN